METFRSGRDEMLRDFLNLKTSEMDILQANPELALEVNQTLYRLNIHIHKLRKTDVEEFRRNIEESPDIESKSRHMRQLIEENVPASLDLLDRLLKDEKDPLLHLEWVSHRQHVAMSVETLEQAQAFADWAHMLSRRLYQQESSGLSDEGIYKAYIKACVNLLLVCKYQGTLCSIDEVLERCPISKVCISELKILFEDLEESIAEKPIVDPYNVLQGYLEEAQKAAKLKKDPDGQHLLQIMKGDLLLTKGHISMAIDTVFMPLLKEPLLSLKNKGLLLQKFGNACRSAGRWGLAKEYLRQSISIAQEMGDRVSEYDRMADLGNVYRSEGRIADALKHQRPHMAFAYKRGDLWGLSLACFNMSLAYYSVRPHPDLKHAHTLLSLHYVDLSIITINPNDNETDILRKYFALSRSLASKVGKSELYELAAAIASYKHDSGQALTSFDFLSPSPGLKMISHCYDKDRKMKKLLEETKTFFNGGSYFRSLGRYDAAIKYHRMELKLAQARGDDEFVALMERELAIDYLCKGDLENAEEVARAAISTLEVIREKLGGEDASKIANFDQNQSETHNLLQIILCQRQKYGEALALCELGRSRALTDLIRDKLLQTREPSAQKNEWIYISDFVSRWQDVAKDIQDDFIQSADELRTNFLMYSVLKEYDNEGRARYFLYIWLVLNGLSAKGENERIHFRKMPLSEKIQSELLVDYEFFSSLTRSFEDQAEGAFSVSKTKEAVHEEPAVEENTIDIRMPQGPEVEELFQMLGFPSPSATDEGVEAASSNQDPQISDESKQKPSSGERAKLILERILEPGSWAVEGIQQLQQLYDICVSPVEDLLPEEEEGGPVPSITILPHEFLFGVPFCSLQNGAGKDKRHLVERFVISYAPSLLALRLLNKRLHHLRAKQGSRQLKVLAMGHALMSKLKKFKELPKSGEEAKNVQDVFGPEHCRVALRGDATKQLMLQELQNIDILHVATHASPQDVEEKKPVGDYSMHGCILLSSSDQTCSGVVRASEIASVDCNCQLVTLSCCETGLGKVTGDGVVGLYRAFFAAGAASVLVTLWKIRDDITRLFMEHFYKEFKATGNVSESLRTTMVYCIREKKLPPQQWAAFSHIGAAL